VDGYDDTSYGERFADVYDDWYHDLSDVDATVAALEVLAEGGPVLELGVGTGRLAIPLAARGVAVTGVDTSTAMLDRLAANDPAGTVTAIRGDMVTGLPDGPFHLVFVAFNTLFNLRDPDRQAACFEAVAQRLTPGGRFVVEAFVPDDPPRSGDYVGVRSITADRVVLTIAVHDPVAQCADGQFVEFTEAGGVRLRPWSIRYSTPAELDAMAAAAGLEREHRWHTFDDVTDGTDADRHVSVYRRPPG
jgi:SAM-dependent methyltransferase